MSEDSSANVIKALKINDLQKRIAELEAQNALLRAVADEAKLFGNKAVLFPGYYTISFQYGENLLAATQADIDGGALREGE